MQCRRIWVGVVGAGVGFGVGAGVGFGVGGSRCRIWC